MKTDTSDRHSAGLTRSACVSLMMWTATGTLPYLFMMNSSTQVS